MTLRQCSAEEKEGLLVQIELHIEEVKVLSEEVLHWLDYGERAANLQMVGIGALGSLGNMHLSD